MQSEFNDKDTFYIFNHVDITIYYHNVENTPDSRLVAAKMEPKRYFISIELFCCVHQTKKQCFSSCSACVRVAPLWTPSH